MGRHVYASGVSAVDRAARKPKRAATSRDVETVVFTAQPSTSASRFDAVRKVTYSHLRGGLDWEGVKVALDAMGLLDEHRAAPEPGPKRIGPHDVACPSCEAPAGEGCRSKRTDDPGRLLGGSRTHVPRQRLIARATEDITEES